MRVYLLTAVVARRLVHLSAACHAALLHLKAGQQTILFACRGGLTVVVVGVEGWWRCSPLPSLCLVLRAWVVLFL